MTKTTEPHEVVRSKEHPTEIFEWIASGTYLGAYSLIIIAYAATIIMTLYLFMA
ncbi:hypothetical protein [Methanonatronarchaeum sp. AMET6-2]|uniref:hypothetical protein n=1 Tax=Methanonatronarchaeum sp. AMET6-2 TaxID=2933293 RepID=UPI001FF1C4E1|nr:hypothetical protein [Methanonatronarchaeum sp. AMET6-2]UOY10079.1 hypothetical protein MU439_00080 [Methanonatronarchaeum sp. AMET6-2]